MLFVEMLQTPTTSTFCLTRVSVLHTNKSAKLSKRVCCIRIQEVHHHTTEAFLGGAGTYTCSEVGFANASG